MTDRIEYPTPAAASDAGYMSIRETRAYARKTGKGGYAIRADWIADPTRDFHKVDYPYDVWIAVQPGETDMSGLGRKVASRYRAEQIDALPALADDDEPTDALDQRTAIRQAARDADTARDRLKWLCIAAHGDGMPIAHIAEAAQVQRSTIYDWISA
jgi:hypothetical protein